MLAKRFHFPGLLTRLILWALIAAPLRAQPPAWTPLGPVGGQVLSLTADPAHAGILYATAGIQGTFKTVNAGESWTPILSGTAFDLAVDPGRPSVLYLVSYPGALLKSVDSGAHWFRPANRGLPAGPGLFRSVEVDPANRNVVYLASNGGVWRSLDAGGSWQNASSGLPGLAVAAFAAFRRPSGTALAGTAAGLYRTTNRGASWSPARGLPSARVTALALSPAEPQTAYVLLFGKGLYRSKDAGASWKPVAAPPSGSQPVYSLAVDPRSPSTLYATLAGGTVLRSTDGAAHWSTAGRLPGSFPVVLTPDPLTPRRLYAGLSPDGTSVGGQGGIFRSDDLGTTWQRRSQGYVAVEIQSLSVPASDPDHLWANAGPLLFHSANRGQRWIRLPSPAGAFSPSVGTIAAASASTVFLSTFSSPGVSSFLWKTVDAGDSWLQALRLTKPEQIIDYRLAPADPETLYVLAYTGGPILPTGTGILRSTDGGDSWQTRVTDLGLGCGVGSLAVAPSASGTLYLTGSGSSPAPVFCHTPLARVLRSTDGGASWTDASAGLPSGLLSPVTVDPNDPDIVYVGYGRQDRFAVDGVWKTADGGATWTRAGSELAGREIAALLATAIPGQVYAARDDGHVFRSEDGGESWQDVTAGLFAAEVFDLVADPSDPDRVYAATTNGVWVLDGAP
jgi:photosystem II stability/assembly factor-like uncharacterized protein